MAEFVEVMRQDARMRRTVESMEFLRRMDDLLNLDPARFEKAVMRWAKLHPEKTMKDVFFEKLPKARRDEDGTPMVCPKVVGFDEIRICARNCLECWNRPAPEE